MNRRPLSLLAAVLACAGSLQAQTAATVTCTNPPLPSLSSAVCEVVPGDDTVLVEATVITRGTVFVNGHLLLGGDGLIACAACDCSATDGFTTATRVRCPTGIAAPGLINLHDHLDWADSPPADHGEERYDHRHDWRKGLRGHTLLDLPPTTSSVYGNSWGELRHLMAATTSIVGPDSAPGFLRNLNDAVLQDGLDREIVVPYTFPLFDSDGLLIDEGCAYPGYGIPYPPANYLLHVAEGVDREARNELLCLAADELSGAVRDIALIHLIGITPEDASLLAERGISLVWSPRSNVSLYGMTTPLSVLSNLGVNLALGTDWLPSGSMNLLRELDCARSLSATFHDSILSDRELVGMVTWNAARAAHMDDVIGDLRPGLFADVAIFDGADRSPFQAVVEAHPSDVALVLKGGVPMYGDAPLMEALGAADGDCELVGHGVGLDCIAAKRVCVTREGAAAGLTLTSLLARFTAYPLVSCNDTPPDEPTCTPFRHEPDGIWFDGSITAEDSDGDGVANDVDNCPEIFNPPRPVDDFAQGDSDGDHLGDACDLCPLSPEPCSPAPRRPSGRRS